MVTTNLEDFGYAQLEELKDLITAMIRDGLPEDFDNDGVHAAFDTSFAYVFLTNADGEIAMLNSEGKLAHYYILRYENNEGFLEDLIADYEEGEIDERNYDELAYILEQNGKYEIAEEITEKVIEKI